MFPMIYMSLVDEQNISDFEKLYRRCRTKAYYSAYDVLKNESLAEECVSEVFLALAKCFDRVNALGEDEQVRYIAVSCRNRALTILEKEKHSAAEVLYDEQESELYANADVSLVEYKELISRLSETDRFVLYHRCIASTDYKQIGQLLGISYTAAKQKCYEAKCRLKKLMKEEWE